MTEKLPVNLQLNKMQQPKSIKFGNTASTIPVQKDEDEAEKKRKEGLMVATLVGLATAAVASGFYYNRHPGKWQEHTGKVKDFFKGNKGKAGASSVETSAPPIPIPASEATNSSTAIQLKPHAKKAEIQAFAQDATQNNLVIGDGMTLFKDGNMVLVSKDGWTGELTDLNGFKIGFRTRDDYTGMVTDRISGFSDNGKNYRACTTRIMKKDGCEQRIIEYGDNIPALKAGDKPVIIREWRNIDSNGKIENKILIKKCADDTHRVTYQQFEDGKKSKSWTVKGSTFGDANKIAEDPTKILKTKIYTSERKKVLSDIKNELGMPMGYVEEVYSYNPSSPTKKTGAASKRILHLLKVGDQNSFGNPIVLENAESHKTLKDNLKASIKSMLDGNPNYDAGLKKLDLDKRSEEQLLYVYSHLTESPDKATKSVVLGTILNDWDAMNKKSLNELIQELDLIRKDAQAGGNPELEKELEGLQDAFNNRTKDSKKMIKFDKDAQCALFWTDIAASTPASGVGFWKKSAKVDSLKYHSAGLTEEQVKSRLIQYLNTLKEQKGVDEHYSKVGPLLKPYVDDQGKLIHKAGTLQPYPKIKPKSTIPAKHLLHYTSYEHGSAGAACAREYKDATLHNLEHWGGVDHTSESTKKCLKASTFDIGIPVSRWKTTDGKDLMSTADSDPTVGSCVNLELPTWDNSVLTPWSEFGVKIKDANGTGLEYINQ